MNFICYLRYSVVYYMTIEESLVVLKMLVVMQCTSLSNAITCNIIAMDNEGSNQSEKNVTMWGSGNKHPCVWMWQHAIKHRTHLLSTAANWMMSWRLHNFSHFPPSPKSQESAFQTQPTMTTIDTLIQMIRRFVFLS